MVHLKNIIIVFLVSLLSLAGSAAAQDTRVTRLVDDYGRAEGHFSLGIDMHSIGIITKDRALGYPRSSIGANVFFGITWRNYFDRESIESVERVAAEVASFYPNLSDDELRDAVKNQLGNRWHKYWGLDSLLFVYPGVEFGATYDFGDSSGEGLQFNIGLVSNFWSSFIPRPNIGFVYSF